MKFLLTILCLISVAYAQQRMPSGDTITYDFSGSTRIASIGPWAAFTVNTTDDWRPTRYVADFNGDSLRKTGNGKGIKGLINFQEEFTFDEDTAIKFYDPSGSRDTMWIFAYDKDHPPTWDQLTNTENYTPTWTIITCGSCAGLPVTTILTSPPGRKVQYILYVFRRTNLFSGLWTDIRKIEFRGTKTGNKDTTYNLANWAFDSWTARPIDSIIGNFNLQNQMDTLWHDTATKNSTTGLGYFRSFDQHYYFPDATKHGKRLDLGGAGYSGYKYNAAMARRGNYQFAAVFNDNAYYKFQLDSIHYSPDKGWGINTIYDDPQWPQSYSEKGLYMHGIVWIGGGCSSCAGVPTFNGTPVPGQGYMKGVCSNNEPTGFFSPKAFKNNLMVAAECHGIYDSVKLGDPNMPVFIAGFDGWGYDNAKATLMAMKLLARSRNIKADGLAYHGFHTQLTDSLSAIPTTSQQIGNHGVSPGYRKDWQKHINYVQGCRRELGNPNFKVQCDEDGYQKGVYVRAPRTDLETFSISQLGAPRCVVNGVLQDAFISHGVIELQELFVCTATPLYKQYKYSAVDDQISSANPGYDAPDANNGWWDRPLTCCTEPPEEWPAGMAASSMILSFGRYQFVDSIVHVTRGLHVFKYKHVTIPDRYLFLYAVLDSVGTASIDLTSLLGIPVIAGTVVTPSFISRTSSTAAGFTNSLSADPLLRGFIVDIPAGGGGGGGVIPPTGIRMGIRIKYQ